MIKLILVLVGVLFLAGCNQEIKGTLTVSDGKTLQLKDEKGGLVNLGSGPAILKIDKQRATLKNNQGQWTMTIPKGINTKASTYAVSAQELGQPVDLRAAKETQLLNEVVKDGFRECRYAGVCYSCFPGDRYSNRCGLNYSGFCMGAEKVRAVVRTSQDVYHVWFHNEGTVTAHFVSEPIQSTHTQVQAVLSSCRPYWP